MENVIQIAEPAKVFNPLFLCRLAEANRAVRQLRRLGCQVIRQAVGDRDKPTEIVVDRNPHRLLAGCPNVHVTCNLKEAGHG